MTYYRIDEWTASQSPSSKIYFENSLAEAMKYVTGMRKVTPQKSEGIEHTTIQPFDGPSCDMEGWINSNAEETEAIHFIHG